MNDCTCTHEQEEQFCKRHNPDYNTVLEVNPDSPLGKAWGGVDGIYDGLELDVLNHIGEDARETVRLINLVETLENQVKGLQILLDNTLRKEELDYNDA